MPDSMDPKSYLTGKVIFETVLTALGTLVAISSRH